METKKPAKPETVTKEQEAEIKERVLNTPVKMIKDGIIQTVPTHRIKEFKGMGYEIVSE